MAQRFQKKSIIHYTLYIRKNYIALILYILYVVNRSEKKYFKVIQQNGHNLARYVHKRVQVIGAPQVLIVILNTSYIYIRVKIVIKYIKQNMA